MYGLWWLVIGFAVILVIGVFLYIHFWYESDTIAFLGICMWAVSALLVFIVGFLAICLPISAKEQYNKFVGVSEMVEQIYDENGSLENAGLTMKVIEMNTWLSDARVNKEMYGNWSMYCNLDLEAIDYISLKGDEA